LTDNVVNLRDFFKWTDWNICVWWNMLTGKFCLFMMSLWCYV